MRQFFSRCIATTLLYFSCKSKTHTAKLHINKLRANKNTWYETLPGERAAATEQLMLGWRRPSSSIRLCRDPSPALLPSLSLSLFSLPALVSSGLSKPRIRIHQQNSSGHLFLSHELHPSFWELCGSRCSPSFRPPQLKRHGPPNGHVFPLCL